MIPKRDGSYRLIQHLSYPSGSSINEHIDPEICSVCYTLFDEVVNSILHLGPHCMLGKMDIKCAFRLLPVHKDDFCLLGFRLDGFYFIDKMLPVGCAISCSLWEKFATFIEWLFKSMHPKYYLHHYLDDFIFLGEKQSSACAETMRSFQNLCSALGVPLAEDTTEGPNVDIVFLGLVPDSVHFQIKIPLDKLQNVISTSTHATYESALKLFSVFKASNGHTSMASGY